MEQILPEKNFKNIRITTNKIINDFLIWKWGSNSSQMFSKLQIPIQITQNCAFPQNFCTRKLGKISVFYFECIWWYWMLVSTLHKTPKFHLISLCGNFVERHSFQRVSTDSPDGSCAFPQNFFSRKLDEMKLFCAVLPISYTVSNRIKFHKNSRSFVNEDCTHIPEWVSRKENNSK